MSFKHKLSKRLAISWRGAPGLVSLAVMLSCRPAGQGLTDPTDAVLVISPDQVALDYQQTVQFTAFLRGQDGDSAPATVQWRATGGSITEQGAFTSDTIPGEFLVTAEDASGRTANASVGAGYSGPSFAVSSTRPHQVTDLAVVGATSNTVTLRFTEVDDGTGQPASYQIRYQQGSRVKWGSAQRVTQGTCASPMAGTTIGAVRSCTVAGLAPTTTYAFRLVAFRGTLDVNATFSSLSNVTSGSTTAGEPPSPPADTVFAEGFESGTLSAWQDGVDPNRHRVLADPGLAHSGSRVLEVTYPAGNDGGWLTRFFLPGYDSLYVSAWVRFASTWQGGTKLLAFYGSRTDNQWSAFGQAGKCPSGTDFFASMVVAEGSGNPGPTRFYSYYPAMAREPDGVTCWGRFGDGTETYGEPQVLEWGTWHQIEFWAKLNEPGRSDGAQTFRIDGVLQGKWEGLSFRTTPVLQLNSLQLTFSNSASTTQTQQLYVDDVVVVAGRGSP